MHWADRIGRRLKLRDLHILLAVVQCGSMAKAARQLSVSSPVVSKAVADLEHALDARLLDRGAQGVEPTIYGRALLDHALCVFDELRQAVNTSSSSPTRRRGRYGLDHPSPSHQGSSRRSSIGSPDNILASFFICWPPSRA